jgi:hypothetical protein
VNEQISTVSQICLSPTSLPVAQAPRKNTGAPQAISRLDTHRPTNLNGNGILAKPRWLVGRCSEPLLSKTVTEDARKSGKP